MSDEVSLRVVLEEDLPFLDQLTIDPGDGGDQHSYGWRDCRGHRRRWAEDGMLNDDGGTLIVATADERLGFTTFRIAHCWNVGIVLAPEATDKGYGSRARRLLADYLFAHSLVNRVEAVTEISNVAEQRALEKAGFSRDGVQRGTGFRDGGWQDGVIYRILRAECVQCVECS